MLFFPTHRSMLILYFIVNGVIKLSAGIPLFLRNQCIIEFDEVGQRLDDERTIILGLSDKMEVLRVHRGCREATAL